MAASGVPNKGKTNLKNYEFFTDFKAIEHFFRSKINNKNSELEKKIPKK
jgi:hypothetical protein